MPDAQTTQRRERHHADPAISLPYLFSLPSATSATSLPSATSAVQPPSILQQAAAHGVFDQLGAAVQVQLVHDVGAVGVHRLGADEQPLADLRVGVALGHQLENLALALGQRAV